MLLQRSVILAAFVSIACGGTTPPADEPAEKLTTEPSETHSEEVIADAGGQPQAPPEPEPSKPDLRWSEGLAFPESVLFDEAHDRYLVSNINGSPVDADGNGYIAALSPDGKLIKAKWIAGGEANVKLDAPKGLGISKGVLWVADLTVLRKFDLKTGVPKGEVAIPGATFLNDVAVGADGSVFVSDSGLKAGAKDFEPSGTDAVWVVDKTGKLRAIAKSTELNRPNGLWPTDKGLLVVSSGSNELVRLDDKGTRQDVTKLPTGGLDGVVALGDQILVSSWQGSAIYQGVLGGTFTLAYQGLKGPADIALDVKRKRLLVPRPLDNAVEAFGLK